MTTKITEKKIQKIQSTNKKIFAVSQLIVQKKRASFELIRRVSLISLFLVHCMYLSMNSVHAQTFHIIPNKTSISFKLSLLGSIERTGKFTRFSGHANFDKSQLNKSKFLLKIATQSVKIDLPSSLQSLNNGDLFDTKKYPYMTFQSDTINLNNLTNTLVKGNIKGTLNFMGKKGLETFKVTLRTIKTKNQKNERLLFVGTAVIDRHKYKIRVPKIAGLGDTIPIRISGVMATR